MIVEPGTTRIGWIGLGVMGRSMCAHLVDAGFSATVYTRTQETADSVLAKGATWADTPKAVAEQSDVMFTIVGFPTDVREVVLGPDGALAGCEAGNVLVDMTTSEPSLAVEIYEAAKAKGVASVDAPVSGGPQGARDAALTMMVGGPSAALERVRPLLALLGPTVIHLGESGAGQTTKACHQLALLVTAQGVAEALTLARRCGLDVERVRQVMMGGMASSRVLDLFGARMASRDFGAGIESRLYHKDLDIALGLAHERGAALPAAALTMQFVNALIGRGRERDDLSALITVVEELDIS